MGNWKGWAKGDGPQARRPASAVTQPVGGAYHTERLFAAVTHEPMRRPMSHTTSNMSDVRPGSRPPAYCRHASLEVQRSCPSRRALFTGRPVIAGAADEGRVSWGRHTEDITAAPRCSD